MNITESFDKLNTLQKLLVMVILVVLTYGLSTSLSYSVFSMVLKKALPGEDLVTALPGPSTALDEDPNEPKTEECPLDGGMHTKKAKDNWEKRRPLAVMIENHQESRSQSGLSNADIIYEAVAEGGITRFMALYYCNLSDIQVGPVRSARTYYLDWLSEYDALYAHVGGANTPGPADALGQIIKYKVKDLNQFGIGYPTFWRDYQRLSHPVATEHTMYSTTTKLWEVGAKRGWTDKDEKGISWNANFTLWKFKDLGKGSVNPSAASSQAINITVNFWESQEAYRVEWSYDSNCNCYKRKNGGSDHMDLNNNRQLSPQNIVVQFERESHANDGYEDNVHLLYGTVGSGKALFFQDGKVVEGKWIKSARTSRTKYADDKGKEISFVRGQIWIQTVPEGSKVNY